VNELREIYIAGGMYT
jgi:hypothetical protein